MEPNSKFVKYAKAKIEEPNLRLPKALLKFNTGQSSEDDTKKPKHLAEEIAAGGKLRRKVYQIRNMELLKAVRGNFEDMQHIHKVSKATITLVLDSESDHDTHSFLYIMGTVEQVKMAEELILDKILKTYEGHVLQLPKALLKCNTDQSFGQLCYIKIFEDDTKKPKHLAEEIAAGGKLDRKVYRIRNMELLKAIGVNFEDMQQMHKVSKATIGLVVDSESYPHTHSFIDLMGTIEQVKMAEELILDKILKTYEGSVFPVILMPLTVYGHEIRLPVPKAARLLGENVKNVLAIEVASGAWIQVYDQPPPGGPEHERIVNIYGPKSHVFKAVSLIHSQVFEPGECDEAEEELDTLFKELSFGEMMEGMKSRTPQMADLMGAAFASGVDSGSCSGQTEELKEQHLEDKDESKGKKKRRHEVDVTEAIAGEPRGSVEELD